MALPVTSKATAYDLTISQGSTFKRIFQVKDSSGNVLDVSGLTATAKIRDLFLSGSLVQVLTCVISGSGLTSQVAVSLTTAQTAALSLPSGTATNVRSASIGFWDLELTDGTDTYRYAEGGVTLSREVTY